MNHNRLLLGNGTVFTVSKVESQNPNEPDVFLTFSTYQAAFELTVTKTEADRLAGSIHQLLYAKDEEWPRVNKSQPGAQP